MSAQGAMNSITGSVLGGINAFAKINEGLDAAMAKKAKAQLKQKLATRKQIKSQINERMSKVGGIK